MASTLLSPTLIWKDFVVPVGVDGEIIEQSVVEGFNCTHLYIDGRTVGSEKVKIYSILLSCGKKNAPAILLLQDFADGMDLSFAVDLCNNGYDVMVVDVAGKRDGQERFTIYPESIGYANLDKSVYGKCEIEEDAKKTCWYEWCIVTRYVIEYLKENYQSPKIGAVAVNGVATVLWQVSATCEDLSAVVAVGNAGWYAYRGIGKFSGVTEPQFSDDAVAFIAGIEPQSYAKQLKCPLLMLSPTNSPDYDCDRAYDTVSRTDESVYTAILYSVGSRFEVDNHCYNDMYIFFEEFLRGKKEKISLPKEVDIKGRIEDNQLVIDVFPDKNNLKGIKLYVAEETVEPCLRAWRRSSDDMNEIAINADGGYTLYYTPYKESKFITYFVEAEYKNGFRVSSLIAVKNFIQDEMGGLNKFKILYSSRLKNSESAFSQALENISSPRGIFLSSENCIQVKKGPSDISGLYGKNGLTTFKMHAKKYLPSDDSLLMMDVYSKTQGTLLVKLISDYFGENRTEYIWQVELTGVDVWRNVKAEIVKFKTAEGMPLKTYEKIQAVEFYSEQEFLINNVLWV